jgi:hypothetical protein
MKVWSSPSLLTAKKSCELGAAMVPAGVPFPELKIFTASTN